MPDGFPKEVEPIRAGREFELGRRAIEVSATVVSDLVDRDRHLIFHDPAERGGVGLPVPAHSWRRGPFRLSPLFARPRSVARRAIGSLEYEK
jgi:hypothetical protein